MKLIKYQVQINFIDRDGKQVKVETSASSEAELLKNVQTLMKKDKKSFLSFFNL